MINIPSDYVADQDTSSDNLAVKMSNYRKAIAKVVATGTKLHKTHMGQMLNFGDANLEILYSHEMRMPTTLGASNNLSIVSRLTIAGQTFFMTGDTHTHSNRVMEPMYPGSSMKSDFFQTPHHGHGPSTASLSTTVDPKWVLWPASQSLFESTKGNSQNQYFFSNVSRVEGIFPARDEVQVYQLPFNGSNYTVSKLQTIS